MVKDASSQEFWGEHVCIFKSLLSGKLNNFCDVKQHSLLLSPGRLLTVYRQLILAACHTGHAELTYTYSHRHHYPFLRIWPSNVMPTWCIHSSSFKKKKKTEMHRRIEELRLSISPYNMTFEFNMGTFLHVN